MGREELGHYQVLVGPEAKRKRGAVTPTVLQVDGGEVSCGPLLPSGLLISLILLEGVPNEVTPYGL